MVGAETWEVMGQCGLRQYWREIGRARSCKDRHKSTRHCLHYIGYREQVLLDSVSFLSPICLPPAPPRDPFSLYLNEGAVLLRKLFINGSPHCSFLEFGQPITFHSSTGPIRGENMLFPFEDLGVQPVWLASLKQRTFPESCLENTHTLAPIFSFFSLFTLCFSFLKTYFQEKS